MELRHFSMSSITIPFSTNNFFFPFKKNENKQISLWGYISISKYPIFRLLIIFVYICNNFVKTANDIYDIINLRR